MLLASPKWRRRLEEDDEGNERTALTNQIKRQLHFTAPTPAPGVNRKKKRTKREEEDDEDDDLD